MSPDEYEQLVSEIVNEICTHAPPLAGVSAKYGKANKIPGRSGYKHQIDVSLSTNKDLYLLECKRWKDAVGVAEVMVLAARMNDVADANREIRVHSILASTKRASRGARALAAHFGVQLEIVESPLQFGMQVGKFISVGLHISAVASDSIDVEVRKKPRAG